MSANHPIKQIVIVGGGTAGWMAAASLSQFLQGKNIGISLIESSGIGTVGVGEATLPSLREFNQYLGIDELAFIRATQATFKLGIQFENWYQQDSIFFHPFGNFGTPLSGTDFHHHWHRARLAGASEPLADYCLAGRLAQQHKFAQPNLQSGHPLAQYNYAFHFDAQAYARLLSDYAQQRGVVRFDNIVSDVELDKASGFIQSVLLDNGQRISGDLFIDCSGFRGLLIEQALHTGYQDWRHWLPCDRAVAVACQTDTPPLPYTRSIALEAGWRWQIPLQTRLGNGYVYCSEYIDQQSATEQLINSLAGPMLSEPKQLRFVTGMRNKMWNKNCVALGLAAGFMEPLESTSIGLIQSGISLLQQFFPFEQFNPHEIAEANRHTQAEFERVRDFLILHYQATSRTDSPLWNYCRTMPIPDTLAHKIALYKARGHLLQYEVESFEDASWLALYTGMNILPKDYNRRADLLTLSQLEQNLQQMRDTLQQGVSFAPSHREFIHKHCAVG
ncbi:tryptophan halogenase family protein [Neptunicella sp.]|uniref:tryptophan halogenase family protein n=1 Tax=Neptunicella sp. TaxID=2125986 RepID=UPI003F68C353